MGCDAEWERAGDGGHRPPLQARVFFVTGCPRSRTAWLANLFSVPGQAFCYHDLLGKVESLDEMAVHLTGERAVGDSDSGLMWLYPEIAQRFPGARWVVIERNPAEAMLDLREFAFESPWHEALCGRNARTMAEQTGDAAAALGNMLQVPGILRVKFEDLDDVEVVRAMWQHCLGPVAFDVRRYRMVNDLLINPHPGKVKLELRPGLAAELNQIHHRGTEVAELTQR